MTDNVIENCPMFELEKKIIVLINEAMKKQWQNTTPVGITDDFPQNIIDLVRGNQSPLDKARDELVGAYEYTIELKEEGAGSRYGEYLQDYIDACAEADEKLKEKYQHYLKIKEGA